MTAEIDLRRLMNGLFAAWAISAEAAVTREGDDSVVRVRQGGLVVLTLRRRIEPFGAVWRVEAPGARARAHRSVQGALRTAGAILAPDRPRARVLFAAGLEHGG